MRYPIKQRDSFEAQWDVGSQTLGIFETDGEEIIGEAARFEADTLDEALDAADLAGWTIHRNVGSDAEAGPVFDQVEPGEAWLAAERDVQQALLLALRQLAAGAPLTDFDRTKASDYPCVVWLPAGDGSVAGGPDRLAAETYYRGMVRDADGRVAGNLTMSTNMGNADLCDADLRDADLREVRLDRSSLSRADLSRADLRDADLHRTNASHANLQGANLQGANLSGADLNGVDLRGANLDGASLFQANLTRADLRGVDLAGVDLQGARVLDTKVDLPDGWTTQEVPEKKDALSEALGQDPLTYTVIACA